MTENINEFRVNNFGAGPGCIPTEVLLEAQKELLNFQGCGKSIMEVSHRGKEFEGVINETKSNLKKLLSISDDYDILFLQGGASSLFAGIPMNLCENGVEDIVDFIVTGSWSKQASNDGKYFCKVNKVVDMEKEKFLTVTEPQSWKFSPDAKYVHYCDNETIHGIEMPISTPDHLPSNLIKVCDMSSNFLSKPIDVNKFDLIFAGAQKNAGISGITIVIIKKSLLLKTKPNVPSVFNFLKKSQNNSLDNTPPTFNIYITGLILKWIINKGGLSEIEKLNIAKAHALYEYIDNSNSFYKCSIDKNYRSRMNVVFRIQDGNTELEEKFIKEASKENITDIKGHRSVGGLRVSLYNAITIDQTLILINFMTNFHNNNK
ncbi:phosphoserine transaminase [Dictyostelium discoideum AX4]|uniref:Probable phosphoserine aminotransferase n=1 Tax=Dictyostelium discoideum TaxID=44689 RepID=SERC_DICDI|nr:phosphoserine transaminase [Dictyostelium discoideum AX4]Q55CQ6.1 RecName: Full=Probable phosphoserine aminotransferase; Short=PSAT; AltName: Full=Phosphohydroxythreonine aminotransferase [Dictyostelium discoideum]EAL72325.1 phosphoserine transaminase [Dictyostelium discoideum AX4]|eukprot:XP_646425.1 phosphoserine transaminase [Dictyostelium discoideum AX4]